MKEVPQGRDVAEIYRQKGRLRAKGGKWLLSSGCIEYVVSRHISPFPGIWHSAVASLDR